MLIKIIYQDENLSTTLYMYYMYLCKYLSCLGIPVVDNLVYTIYDDSFVFAKLQLN